MYSLYSHGQNKQFLVFILIISFMFEFLFHFFVCLIHFLSSHEINEQKHSSMKPLPPTFFFTILCWVKPQVHGSTDVVIKRVSFRQGVMNLINFQQWIEEI